MRLPYFQHVLCLPACLPACPSSARSSVRPCVRPTECIHNWPPTTTPQLKKRPFWMATDISALKRQQVTVDASVVKPSATTALVKKSPGATPLAAPPPPHHHAATTTPLDKLDNTCLRDVSPAMSTPNLACKQPTIPLALNHHNTTTTAATTNNHNQHHQYPVKPMQNGNAPSHTNSTPFNTSTTKPGFGQAKAEVVNTANTTTLSRSFGNLLNNINSKVTSAVNNILPLPPPTTNDTYNNRDV